MVILKNAGKSFAKKLEKSIKKVLTLSAKDGILDKLPLESARKKHLNKNFEKSLKKMLTRVSESGNINKLSHGSENK